MSRRASRYSKTRKKEKKKRKRVSKNPLPSIFPRRPSRFPRRRPCNPDFLPSRREISWTSFVARSFIQPRHGTPFVTILSIAVEQETDSETATRPPFASPRIGPIDSSRSRENRLPPSPLPPLPPIPINPFPRIDDHTYIYIYIVFKALEYIRPRHSIRRASIEASYLSIVGSGKSRGSVSATNF